MAIVRSAGTEIIRSAHFEDVDDTVQILIQGVQHHIYTVLSIICYCAARSGTEAGYLSLVGYDSHAGTTAQTIALADVSASAGETFVWDNKFSFNGYEPTDFTGQMNGADDQDAIADQGSSVAQILRFATASSSTKYDITVTFIDQNNS